jgi:hypothetical protein
LRSFHDGAVLAVKVDEKHSGELLDGKSEKVIEFRYKSIQRWRH